jgi:hypothetical protein
MCPSQEEAQQQGRVVSFVEIEVCEDRVGLEKDIPRGIKDRSMPEREAMHRNLQAHISGSKLFIT